MSTPMTSEERRGYDRALDDLASWSREIADQTRATRELSAHAKQAVTERMHAVDSMARALKLGFGPNASEPVQRPCAFWHDDTLACGRPGGCRHDPSTGCCT
tara:strand:+ start:7064 stop:7369 length:306 start_codon:yes stop_codon:yes gene_type:complete